MSSKPSKKPATGTKKKPAAKAAKSSTTVKSATATKPAPKVKRASKTLKKPKVTAPATQESPLSLVDAVRLSIAQAAAEDAGPANQDASVSIVSDDAPSAASAGVSLVTPAPPVETRPVPSTQTSAPTAAATSSFASLIAEFERRNREAAGQSVAEPAQPAVPPRVITTVSTPVPEVVQRPAIAPSANVAPPPAAPRPNTPPRTLYRHVAPTKQQSSHQDYRYNSGAAPASPPRSAPQQQQPQGRGSPSQSSPYDSRPQASPALPPPPQIYSFGQQKQPHQQQQPQQQHRPFKSAREAFAAPAEQPRRANAAPLEPVAPARKRFEDLITIDPQPRLTLEYRGCPDSCRLVDLFCPIGRGQRALIVSPPKAGKTTLLKDISGAIARNHPEVELIALLVDERPEEVTDFQRHFATLGPKARVIASSNDHGVDKHIAVSTTTIAECKRGVEEGRHIVVVLDSLTRLGRAFNLSRKHASSGRTLSGGLDARALEIPRQIFGAARNTEDAGSLTIIATCLTETGSRGDDVIFEEFKGSGNMELILDRKISDRRMFPAINLAASGTRKEHLMLSPDEIKTMTALRRQLLAMPPHVQVERLLAAMKKFATNEALVSAVIGQPGMAE